MNAPSENHAFVLAVEGERKAQSINAPADADAAALLSAIRRQTGRDDLIELLWEDVDDAIAEAEHLAERLEEDFRLLHAASGGSIEVKVRYDNDGKEKHFRPSATIRRLISWAISPDGFNLVGEVSDFQIKFEDRVVPPDTHIGQLARCGHTVTVLLVHNIKPQG